MQCTKLKRAMEEQGHAWPLATEVKVLANGKKQTVRSIVDDATLAAAAPSLQHHVETSFFHNVKFKGHLCAPPRPSPPLPPPRPSSATAAAAHPPAKQEPRPCFNCVNLGHRNRPARLAAIDKAMADMPRLVQEYRYCRALSTTISKLESACKRGFCYRGQHPLHHSDGRRHARLERRVPLQEPFCADMRAGTSGGWPGRTRRLTGFWVMKRSVPKRLCCDVSHRYQGEGSRRRRQINMEGVAFANKQRPFMAAAAARGCFLSLLTELRFPFYYRREVHCC